MAEDVPLGKQQMKASVVIADDHSIVAEALCRLLEDQFEILATVQSGPELLEKGRLLRPDVVLADLFLPGLTAIEAIPILRAATPNTRFVLVTHYSERPYVESAFAAGVHGYICKQSSASELVSGMLEVVAGRYFVSPLIAEAHQASIDPFVNPASAFSHHLTTRQREILNLVAEGKQAKQIAAILNISPKTVEFHKAGLMDCLGLRTTAELTRYAVASGRLPLF